MIVVIVVNYLCPTRGQVLCAHAQFSFHRVIASWAVRRGLYKNRKIYIFFKLNSQKSSFGFLVKESYLVGVLCFDWVLPVGVCRVRVWSRVPRRQQSVAQIDRLLILWGGRGWGGAEVQGSAQPILCHLPIRGPTIWGVPTHSQYLRGGQGRQPVGAATLWGVVIWQKGWRCRFRDELCECLSSLSKTVG